MAMAMWITPLQILPERTRMGATLGVAFITGILPLCVLLLMLRAGMVTDLSLSRRRQRLIPMLVTIVAYLGAALYLHLLHAPVWLTAFFIGRMDSRKGWLSMSPTVPPISTMATSVSGVSSW